MYSYSLPAHQQSFNSRTRKGCDIFFISPRTKDTFQFTHPQGVRFADSFGRLFVKVSIHAPARGAIFRVGNKFSLYGFNSRTRKGCDHEIEYHFERQWFQFTHPQGVRYCVLHILLPLLVSIHAPARGAICFQESKNTNRCFNSRTRKGCDQLQLQHLSF